MQQAAEETMRLHDEKNRLMVINNILEQRIQIEKSEKLTVLSEAENINRQYLKKDSSSHNISFKIEGIISNYIRKQNFAMISMKSRELNGSIIE
jgi:ssRNA-specific RNase YbeY (16S rRNA maturation enzyme)